MTIHRYLACGLAVAVLLTACAKPLPSGERVETQEITARVTGIDRAARLITVDGERGNQFAIEATDAVSNFDQIQVGDTVAVTYTEAMAWEVKKGSEGAVGVTEAAAAQKAAPGEKPAGAAGRLVMVTAAITAIDMQKGTVTLRGPSGRDTTVKVRDPAKLKQVSVGDLVDISYTEALAVAVRPTAPPKK